MTDLEITRLINLFIEQIEDEIGIELKPVQKTRLHSLAIGNIKSILEHISIALPD